MFSNKMQHNSNQYDLLMCSSGSPKFILKTAQSRRDPCLKSPVVEGVAFYIPHPTYNIIQHNIQWRVWFSSKPHLKAIQRTGRCGFLYTTPHMYCTCTVQCMYIQWRVWLSERRGFLHTTPYLQHYTTQYTEEGVVSTKTTPQSHTKTLEGVAFYIPHHTTHVLYMYKMYIQWRVRFSTYHTLHHIHSGGCGFRRNYTSKPYGRPWKAWLSTYHTCTFSGGCGFRKGMALYIHVPHPTTLYTKYIPGFGHVLL